MDPWMEVLRDELEDLIEAERFEGPVDFERRVLRRLDHHLRQRHRAGELRNFGGYRVHMPEAGIFEVLFKPGPPRVRQVVLRLGRR